MKGSLKGKLILSYLAVALITVLVVLVVIRLTSGRSLMSLVVEQQTAQLKDSAQTYYSDHGSMDGFFDYYMQTALGQPARPQPDGPNPHPERREIRGLNGLVDSEYRALIPTFGYNVGQAVPSERIQKTIPVEVDGQIVAYILPDNKFDFQLSPEERLFLQRTTLALALAALAGVLIAVSMGFLLAGGLLKPIRHLTRASRALAGGELQQQVPVTSNDELGQLTTTFNQMSADLLRADEQRKRLTADISHDLSTPLQVISGYVEMFEEGEVALTPQRIETIKVEIENLRRLVGDLSTLTQVEAGGLEVHLQPIEPSVLLERIYQAYQPIADRQGVDLELALPDQNACIEVDEGRMLQVLKNLIENALRYTNTGGEIVLKAIVGDRVELQVEDNGSGIDASDLPFVFDRFYRADKARGGNSGKMGLGLAICKALVTAQGGEISAESSGKGQGTTIKMTFNRAPA